MGSWTKQPRDAKGRWTSTGTDFSGTGNPGPPKRAYAVAGSTLAVAGAVAAPALAKGVAFKVARRGVAKHFSRAAARGGVDGRNIVRGDQFRW